MNVFDLRNRLIDDYRKYILSFINIRDPLIRGRVDQALSEGALWPDPLIQLNPSFAPGETVDQLVTDGLLHAECRRIFRKGKSAQDGGTPLRLHRHQADAIKVALTGANYVLTTGTGSGKSLAYILPIVNHVLRNGSGKGIQAIVVYPMNALANSQRRELEKFLGPGYPEGKPLVTFRRYTGQEKDEEKQAIIADPPDILLTNYVMLELILTRPDERPLVQGAAGLRYLVLDELHTYRGRQGADVALLVRRAREAFAADRLQVVGTSATLAGEGTWSEQRDEVARVASLLFGATVHPQNVIGETLQRVTPSADPASPAFVEKLRARLAEPLLPAPKGFVEFANDPLSAWIESTFGLRVEPATGRLVRTTPRGLTGEDGAARELAGSVSLPEDLCRRAVEQQLLASYGDARDPATGFPVFAFRLHQFLSRGDTVYASLEPEAQRYITLQGQQFVPGDRTRALIPLVFCRECGQEYYCVRRRKDPETGGRVFQPREMSDRTEDESDDAAGFLYASGDRPWPTSVEQATERLPDDWLEERGGTFRVRPNRRGDVPQIVRLDGLGREAAAGLDAAWVAAPFRFCLRCGVSWGHRQTSDFPKLASLATEGRSTATTVLSLTVVRALRADGTLPDHARKLLSFTDNRQDASLQAGHFNDFIEIGLLRSALYKAVAQAGPAGLTHEVLVQGVFDSLALPIDLYAVDPQIRFQALEETRRALRAVLAHRLYRDLQRGWRITLPNLEQCGLLEIRYLSLDDVCAAQDVWEKCHPALASAQPETRREVARTLLDFMRRELAIKVDALDPLAHERLRQLSDQRLAEPWRIDENEKLETWRILFPSPRPDEARWNVHLSPRGGFGLYLRRPQTFPEHAGKLSMDDSQKIIRELLGALRQAGLVQEVVAAKTKDEVPGYQVPASALLWVVGDGSKPFHDPIRVPNPSDVGGRVNPFFVEFYRTIASHGVGIQAREHTAQVPAEERILREERFSKGELQVLYCSPTMELGVDIADLNVVNLRNVPPTPANYAQRSGRAGRSGQPALVFTYCSTYRSHDQHFFRRPDRMVAGAVTPPRLDVANEDLVRAHVHAVWLAEAQLKLGASLKDVLDLTGDEPTLAPQTHVREALNQESTRTAARSRVDRILASLVPDLKQHAGWWSEGWVEQVLQHLPLEFDRACERWRGLYSAARKQVAAQNRLITDASRSADEKARAKTLRREAESQLELLEESRHALDADFYSYRYFASEGFLPGYSFPRLPLSAYIPGRREKQGRNHFLSRPRFLAITEFGPRAIVYHEGTRYKINKVILPVSEETSEPSTTSAKQCDGCGYLHPAVSGAADVCNRCGKALPAALGPLFRLQNVSTVRAARINSDEEERLRLGYEIRSGVRFADHSGQPSCRVAQVRVDGAVIGDLAYGHAATLWRINLGWTRRAKKDQLGFVLDLERGYWQKNSVLEEEDPDDPMSSRCRRVIPYVDDRRNCLLLQLGGEPEEGPMASLQAALKNAIQVEYQLEEQELAAEPLPNRAERRFLLFYEAAEGGAGVLRRLLDNEGALARVARRALEICHFDPATGDDLRKHRRAKEDCEAACYDCLMSYMNQQDHELLDRQQIRELLMQLARAQVESAPGPVPRAAHLATLMRQCQSGLERDWLQFLEERGLRLPSRGQVLVEKAGTRPDFLYDEQMTAVYIDGPHHEFPERAKRDAEQTEKMEDLGWTVARFGLNEEWEVVIAKSVGLFQSQ